MRILSLGHPCEDESIDHADYVSARTMLEYDVVLLDTAEAIVPDYGYGRPAVFEGAPCVDEHQSAAIREAIRRRNGEIQDILKAGKVLVLFVGKPQRWALDTGRREYSGTGRNQKTFRIHEHIESADLVSLSLQVHRAEGDRIVTRGGPPWSDFLTAVDGKLTYSARIDNFPGTPNLFIEGTQSALGGTISVDEGLVIVLPTPGEAFTKVKLDDDGEDDDDEYWDEDADSIEYRLERGVSDALRTLVSSLRATEVEPLPAWADAVLLPGEAAALDSLNELETEAAAIAARAAEKRRDLVAIGARKVLLSGTGQALERQVESAFRALGAEATPGPAGRDDLLVSWGPMTAVVEVKGTRKSAAEKHAAQLEKWASAYLEEHGEQAKAILVVNAFRAQPPRDRTDPAFPPQMLAYSKARQHCLVTTSQLLWAVIAVELGERDAAEILASLFSTVGEWDQFTEPGPSIELRSAQ